MQDIDTSTSMQDRTFAMMSVLFVSKVPKEPTYITFS